MALNDEEPVLVRKAQAIDQMSVEELEYRIGQLKAEIAACEAEIEKKKAQKRAADALFANLADRFLSEDGIVELLARLDPGGFLAAINDKGGFAGLTRTCPVHVVMNPDLPLLGAARHAAKALITV